MSYFDCMYMYTSKTLTMTTVEFLSPIYTCVYYLTTATISTKRIYFYQTYSGIVQQFLWIQMWKILTELLFKVDYISWCKWFLLSFNTHMINFGNTNTCKDAANLVLHVARLKAQHYARKSCTKTKIPPNSRKFYADFALIFWKTGKIATYLLSLNVWGLVRKILALKRTLFQRFHV